MQGRHKYTEAVKGHFPKRDTGKKTPLSRFHWPSVWVTAMEEGVGLGAMKLQKGQNVLRDEPIRLVEDFLARSLVSAESLWVWTFPWPFRFFGWLQSVGPRCSFCWGFATGLASRVRGWGGLVAWLVYPAGLVVILSWLPGCLGCA